MGRVLTDHCVDMVGVTGSIPVPPTIQNNHLSKICVVVTWCNRTERVSTSYLPLRGYVFRDFAD